MADDFPITGRTFAQARASLKTAWANRAPAVSHHAPMTVTLSHETFEAKKNFDEVPCSRLAVSCFGLIRIPADLNALVLIDDADHQKVLGASPSKRYQST